MVLCLVISLGSSPVSYAEALAKWCSLSFGEVQLVEKEGSSGGKTKRPVVVEDCGELGGGGGKTRERSPRR